MADPISIGLMVGPTLANAGASAAFSSALAGATSFGFANSVAGFASAVSGVSGMFAPAAGLIGAGMSALGARNAGISAEQEAEYRARQDKINAGQERASGQRASIEEIRQLRLAQSRGQAIAAASGAGALDPSVMDIMGDLETDGRYRAATAAYEGEDRARNKETSAMLSRYSGKQARSAGNTKAISTIMSGVSDLYSKYDGGSYG
jgi:hypothetical protein